MDISTLVHQAIHESRNGGVTEETMQALETPHGRPTWVIKIDDDGEVIDEAQIGSTNISQKTLDAMGVAVGRRVGQLIAEGKFPEHLLHKKAIPE